MESKSPQQDDVFRPVQTPQEVQSVDEGVESHGRREDLTADTNVKAPGIVQRIVEEVEAIASEVWAAITPGSSKK